MPARWVPVYIGIGSNLANPVEQVGRAFEALATMAENRLVARSRLYRSPPMGPQDQPDYVNAVAGMLSQQSAATLLAGLHAIEDAHGRDRGVPAWGPRTLDLDLLVYGAETIDTPRLTVPHPGVTERAFVLVPLAEIAPDLRVPRHGRVADLAARAHSDDLETLQ